MPRGERVLQSDYKQELSHKLYKVQFKRDEGDHLNLYIKIQTKWEAQALGIHLSLAKWL